MHNTIEEKAKTVNQQTKKEKNISANVTISERK